MKKRADRVLEGNVEIGPSKIGRSVPLDSDEARAHLGSKDETGHLTIYTPVTRTDSHRQEYTVAAPGFNYDGDEGTLSIGDVQLGVPGVIKVGALSTRACIQLDSQSASITLGANGLPAGNLTVRDRIGRNTIVLDGEGNKIDVGGAEKAGNVTVKKGDGSAAIAINGQNASITCGGDGGDGDLILKNAANISTIVLDGDNAKATFGSQGVDGRVFLRDSSMTNVISLEADDGNIRCGANGKDGDLIVRNEFAQTTVHVSGGTGNITCGGNGSDGDVILKDAGGQERIHMDGATGDIKLTGADFAEDFNIHDAVDTKVEPGTVMVIAGEGAALQPCALEYDKRVAGVVSGAGGFKPGIIMDKQEGDSTRLPVALSGKVYCMVDASSGPIAIGDLLTTSPTEGHAMKASDAAKAFGSVIGKALGGLEHGRGLIPVLVSLQ